MSIEKLNKSLIDEIKKLSDEGRAKAPERVIEQVIPPVGKKGVRYKLRGFSGEYLRMNSNSYLGLSNDSRLIEAADRATHEVGVGPGAVRFIDGTFSYHVDLETRIANFCRKPAARILNSAYTANLGLALTLTNKTTYWIGDQLNHNSIIRALRIAAVDRERRAIFAHNNMDELAKCLENVPSGITRVIIITDGVYSMRGDYAPLDQIVKIAEKHEHRFPDGVITVVDDSHGIGAYGETGRGTVEITKAKVDIIVGTFGKAFGCNGGFVAASNEVVEAMRHMCDTYIYTNPLSCADCAATLKAIDILDSQEGLDILKKLRKNTERFREGVSRLGIETIPGIHPIVPILVRDTKRVRQIVEKLFLDGILVVGLTYPVVPVGDETIRVQISAAHTDYDIDYALECFEKAFKS